MMICIYQQFKFTTMTQLQMINKTKSIAQQDENVSAVFMYGSFLQMKATNILTSNFTSF